MVCDKILQNCMAEKVLHRKEKKKPKKEKEAKK
jgi:hypothetical protein